jgi:hypothetical protein
VPAVERSSKRWEYSDVEISLDEARELMWLASLVCGLVAVSVGMAVLIARYSMMRVLDFSSNSAMSSRRSPSRRYECVRAIK